MRLITLVVFGAAAWNGVHDCAPPQCRADDGIDAIAAEALTAYRTESAERAKDSSASPEETREWQRRWKERFLALAQSKPRPKRYTHLLLVALSLSNSSGDFEKSLEILDILLAANAEPSRKSQWHAQKGSLLLNRYRLNQEDGDRRAAIAAFKKAVEESERVPDSLPKILKWRQLGEEIRALACLGELYAATPDGAQEAADAYAKARRLMHSAERVAPKRRVIGVDAEGLLRREMSSAIRAQNDEQALEALQALVDLEGPRRWAPSYYALKYAQERYKDRPAAFQDFLRGWLSNAEEDDYFAYATFYLGNSYYQSKNWRAAKQTLEGVLKQYRRVLLKKDAAVTVKQSGGYLADVLFLLTSAGMELKLPKDVVKRGREFLRHVPKDPRRKIVERQVKWAEGMLDRHNGA